jgi:hypothetical protein
VPSEPEKLALSPSRMNLTSSFVFGLALSDWLAAFGALVAFVGIPVTWILARRSRRAPQLRSAVDFDVVVDPTDGLLNQGLSLSFRGNDVERISRSYVAFWNHSGDTVNWEDVVTNDVLRVALRDADDLPLQTRVVLRSREQNQFESLIENDEVVLRFLFLDAGDGGVIEVLHRGRTAPMVVGTVKGAKIRQIGSRIDLSPSAVAWMAESSRLGRLKQRYRMVMERRLLRRLFLAVVIASLLNIGVSSFPLIFDGLRKPRLIDPSKFDLHTLQGQYDFSSMVASNGLPSSTGRLLFSSLVVISVLMLLAGVFLVAGLALIPRSIVAERVPQTSDDK